MQRRAFGQWGGRIGLWLAAASMLAPGAVRADAVETLRAFARDVPSGRADFTQTVTSADGARKRSSSGTFEFERPNRFRFAYSKPFVQTIVADGQKVWIHDPDLNQVTVRPLTEALGATPAALLTGAAIDKEFALKALPDRDGLSWVEATPRAADGPFKRLRVGFAGATLAALEILDSFDSLSALRFSRVEQGVRLPADTFRFVVPPGAEVLSQ